MNQKNTEAGLTRALTQPVHVWLVTPYPTLGCSSSGLVSLPSLAHPVEC